MAEKKKEMISLVRTMGFPWPSALLFSMGFRSFAPDFRIPGTFFRYSLSLNRIILFSSKIIIDLNLINIADRVVDLKRGFLDLNPADGFHDFFLSIYALDHGP